MGPAGQVPGRAGEGGAEKRLGAKARGGHGCCRYQAWPACLRLSDYRLLMSRWLDASPARPCWAQPEANEATLSSRLQQLLVCISSSGELRQLVGTGTQGPAARRRLLRRPQEVEAVPSSAISQRGPLFLMSSNPLPALAMPGPPARLKAARGVLEGLCQGTAPVPHSARHQPTYLPAD